MPTKQSAPQRLLTESEAAEYLRLSVSFLRAARLKDPRTSGPPIVRMGRAVRYLVTDLDTWLQSRREVCA
jgi:hypothetical protein